MTTLQPSVSAKLTKCGLSTLASLMLLSGCASAPPACPSLPEKPVRAQLGPSFQERMQGFLFGKLPEPTNSETPSGPATGGSTQ